jgi:hypothetical protein
MTLRHNSELLPLEYPLVEAVEIYARRLGTVLTVAASNFVVLGMIVLLRKAPWPSLMLAVAGLLTGTIVWLLLDRILLRLRLLGDYPAVSRTLLKSPLIGPKAISRGYTREILRANSESLDKLATVLRELSVPTDKRLASLGEKILYFVEEWEVEPYESQLFPSFPLLSRIRLFQEKEFKYKQVWASRLWETLNRYQKRTVFTRMLSGTTFALQFNAPRKGSVASSGEYTEYVNHAAFWLAFYADPATARERLVPDVGRLLSGRYSPDPQQMWQRWENFLQAEDFSQPLPSFWLYDHVNFLSLLLVSPGPQSRFDDPRRDFFIENVARLLIRYSMRKRWKRHEDLTTSAHKVLLSNILAWSLQTGRHEIAHHAIRTIEEEGWEDVEFSPFIKFII